MTDPVAFTYAARSLTRHTRRTLLSALGIGVGAAMALLASAWIRGTSEMQIRAIAECGGGHLRVVPTGWTRSRDTALRLADWRAALALVRARPHVRHVAVRARANALLAFGNRSLGVELTGADPSAEPVVNRIVSQGRIEGRYLQPGDGDSVVIGAGVARRLDVRLGDPLCVTLAGRDGIAGAMLTVVGIIHTGSRDIDAALCHTTWHEVARITGRPGPGELSILLDDYRRIDAEHAALAAAVPAGDEIITWREINPGLAANVQGDQVFMKVIIGLIVLVVSLGIASAQLTAVLERRKEFAMLSALGMQAGRLVALVMLEALLIGLAGSLVAVLLGGSGAYYLAVHGVSMAAFGADEAYTVGNVILDPVLYADFGPWVTWLALGIAVTATLAATLYPAWHATRIDPAEALRL